VFAPGEVLLAREGTLTLAFADADDARGRFGRREYFLGISGNIREARALQRKLADDERAQLEKAVHLAATALAGDAPSRDLETRLDRARSDYRAAVRRLRRDADGLRYHQMETHRKLSMAFGPLAMLLLGVPLGLRLGRGGRLAGFTVGIAAIALVYYPLWMAGQGLAVSGALPAGLAVWTPPAVIGCGGAYWLSRMV
jgi:lipopolysaccharide export LptBFGC system permease protein LptF